MKKRVFVVVLALVLMISMFPVGAAAASNTLRLPKKLTVLLGIDEWLDLFDYNDEDLPSDYKISISPKRVARLYQDSEGDWSIKGVKKGTATLTLSSKKMKKKVTCKVSVKTNVYSASKPRSQKGELYASLKKMSYSGSDVVVEIFLYNKTGKTVYGIQGLKAQMVIDDEDAAASDIPKPASDVLAMDEWKPKGGKIKNNSYAVMKLRFPNVMDGEHFYMLRYYEVVPLILEGSIIDSKSSAKPMRKTAVRNEEMSDEE